MMKLFFFNPNDYGAEYIVMSDSKETALVVIKEHLLKEKIRRNWDVDVYDYNKWGKATLDKLPDEYTIDEFKKDCVIETYNG